MAQKPFDDETDEKPLDPAAERVRRKLMRFMAINLGLLFTAVMVVVAALVYKGTQAPAPAAVGAVADADIVLPAGARMIGHGFSDGRISIDAELADGSRTVFVYDVAAQQIVGRYRVRAQ